MKIVSFNIRCDYCQDGNNNFEFRKNHIIDKINTEDPDIIGFQEVLPHIHQWLIHSLNNYIVVGCGRSEDFEDEHMTIALHKDRVQLLGLDNFWLSKTPYSSGSRYVEQSICPRMCTHVFIKHKDFNTPMHIYNTHLDHIGASARSLGLAQIYTHMKEDKLRYDYPLVLMGDFNAPTESDEMQQINYDIIKLQDVAKDLGSTFHNFGKKEDFVKIDYLLISEELQATDAYFWDDEYDGVYLSDHYPICAEILSK